MTTVDNEVFQAFNELSERLKRFKGYLSGEVIYASCLKIKTPANSMTSADKNSTAKYDRAAADFTKEVENLVEKYQKTIRDIKDGL